MDRMAMLQALLTPADLLALAFFLVATFGYAFATKGGRALSKVSLIGAVQNQRVLWMENMAQRENRNVDVLLLGTLGQGNAFFASTSAIALGGAAALLGSGERAQLILERLPLVQHSPPVFWECKLLLIMAIFIFAFFKFAWAFRLSHYGAIMIGATPFAAVDNAAECREHARRTAGVVGLAAEHANSGLRSFYYAFSVLAWFFHPLAFVIATLWVLLILIRRDFFSRSRRLIAGGGGPPFRLERPSGTGRQTKIEQSLTGV